MADEYDDFSDEEQGMQHINDDEIGYGGCYGYSGSGVSKFTTVLIDNIFPTAKTSIIGKEVGEFELLTSSSVWNKKSYSFWYRKNPYPVTLSKKHNLT